jgi:hypothetical protein
MSHVRLFLGSNFEDFWESTILPWFQNVRNAWSFEQRCIVLVPDRTFSFFLKSELLKSKLFYAGIYIWTPQEYRNYLVQFLCPSPQKLSRESLHLLMSIAAEKHLESKNSSIKSMATAIAAHPSELVHCLDELLNAGCSFDDLPGDSIRPIVQSFQKLIKQSDAHLVQEIDCLLKEHCLQKEPVLKEMLILGFHCSHWPLWNLLQAAVYSSEAVSACLTQPRWSGERMDQLWISSWEETFETQVLPTAAGEGFPRPFSDRVEKMESRTELLADSDQKKGSIIFHVGQNTCAEARAIALQTIDFLSTSNDARIGIVFPTRGALSREISSHLIHYGIEHNDGLGHYEGIDDLHELWDAWLAFEENPSFKTFFPLLDQSFERGVSLPFSSQKIKAILMRAFQDVLVDDLNVLSAYLIQNNFQEEQIQLGHWLKRRQMLPEMTSFKEWLEKTRLILGENGLGYYSNLILARASSFGTQIRENISKKTYLKWLSEITDHLDLSRDPSGSHPYSRVHLLTYSQAEQQSWSHLILTSLNDTCWPPIIEGSGFLTDQEIQQLNTKAVKMGSQGEGHFCLQKEKGLCLGAAEQRILVQRQFYNLIDSVKDGLCITACKVMEGEVARMLTPSHFFSRLYWIEKGLPLSEEEWRKLSEKTSRWLEQSELKEENESVDFKEEVRRAYTARRDIEQPFSEYEFSLKTPISHKVTLACKEWGRVFAFPAQIWMKEFLGVSCEEYTLDEDRWMLVTGEWIHRWLKAAIDPHDEKLCKFPNQKNLLSNFESAARSLKNIVEKSYSEASLSLPMWWQAGWGEAFWKSQRILQSLSEFSTWKFACPEWSIPKGFMLPIGKSELRLKGRLDLMLCNSDSEFSDQDVVILDYKTGKEEDPAVKKLKEGKGIQIALYGLVLQKMKARSVWMSYIKPKGISKKSLSLEDLKSCPELWEGLCRMQDSGVFGMLEDIRPEFSRSTAFPLAILPVDPDILKAKWDLTHPLLCC